MCQVENRFRVVGISSPFRAGFRLFLYTILFPLSLAVHAGEWSLERSIEFALENNPDARLASIQLDVDRSQIQFAHSAYFPQVTFGAGYSVTNIPMHAFGAILNQEAFNFGLDFNRPGRIDNLNLTGTVGYSLYNGGLRKAGVDAAEAGERRSKEDLQGVRQRLAFAVVEAYFNLVMADEIVRSTESAVLAFEKSVETARLKFEGGTFLKTEVLNLEVQLAQSRETLVNARHSHNLGISIFRNILGLKSDDPVIFGDPKTEGNLLEDPLPGDRGKRPDLEAAEAAIAEAEAMLQQVRAGKLPEVQAYVGGQHDSGLETGGNGTGWIAGLRVNWNVFDGHRVKAQVEQAEARLARAIEMKRKLELAIDLEIERARLTHDQALERLKVTEKIIEQATESAELNRSRFERGVILSSELIDVETRLTNARVRRAVAQAQEWIALADLRRSLGLNQI